MSAPLVSIPLCTYNGARFVEAQLESLLSQDYPNFEIVVVDDGSDDATVALVQRAASRDARITVHVNPHNLGFAANFERASQLCKGAFIAPCDQDDIWLPHKLSTLMARRRDAALVYADSALVDETGASLDQKLSDRVNPYAGSDPRCFAFHNCVSGHAMLCSRELIDLARPFPAAFFHDHWLAFAAAATSRIEYVDECLVLYRQHGRAITDLARLKGKKGRRRGVRLRSVEELAERLRHMRAFPGNPHRDFFVTLHELWLRWQHSYFSADLSRFLLQHRDILFAIPKKSDRWRRRRCRQYFWGLRSRRLTQPREYGSWI